MTFNPDWTLRPGVTLHEWLVENAMDAHTAAAGAGLDRDRFAGILGGTVEITDEDAAALEQLTSTPAQFWLNYERRYRADLANGIRDVSDWPLE